MPVYSLADLRRIVNALRGIYPQNKACKFCEFYRFSRQIYCTTPIARISNGLPSVEEIETCSSVVSLPM